MRHYNFQFILLVLHLFSACKDENLPPAQQEPVDEPSVPVWLQVTRASDPTTYRALLYSAITANTYSATGAYRDPDAAGDWLTPCQVDNVSGAWTADNTQYGLRAGNASWLLTLVSPAAMPVVITTGRTGYLLTREPPAGETDLKFTPPVWISVNGIAINGQYRYSVAEALTPRRAKVTIMFTCGEDMTFIILKKLALTNLIKSGWYLPHTSIFEPKESETLTLLNDGTDTPVTLNKGDNPHIFATHYILPMNYSLVDEQGKPVYDYFPMLDIGLGSAAVSYPLLYDIKPMHEYTYNFIVNSNSITPKLTVQAWQDGGTTDADDTPLPTGVITLPSASIKLDGWTSGGASGDGIGS